MTVTSELDYLEKVKSLSDSSFEYYCEKVGIDSSAENSRELLADYFFKKAEVKEAQQAARPRQLIINREKWTDRWNKLKAEKNKSQLVVRALGSGWAWFFIGLYILFNMVIAPSNGVSLFGVIMIFVNGIIQLSPQVKNWFSKKG